MVWQWQKEKNKPTNQQNNTKDPCIFFLSFFWRKKSYILYQHKLYQQLRSKDVFIMYLVHICQYWCRGQCDKGEGIVILQGWVIKGYLEKDARAEKEVEKEEEKGGGEGARRDGRSQGVSTSLYLPGKHVNAQSKWTGETRAWLLLRW